MILNQTQTDTLKAIALGKANHIGWKLDGAALTHYLGTTPIYGERYTVKDDGSIVRDARGDWEVPNTQRHLVYGWINV